MTEEPEDLEAWRKRREMEKRAKGLAPDRDEMRRLIDLRNEMSKDQDTIDAFVDVVVAIVRASTRAQPGATGVEELHHFLQMLRKEPPVSLSQLVEAATERLSPAHLFATHPAGEFDRYLNRIARAGAALFIELGARDGYARGRRSKRQDNLLAAIESFTDFREKQSRQWEAERRKALIDSIVADRPRKRTPRAKKETEKPPST